MGGKYLSSLSLGLRGALEYRANFFFSLLGAVSPVIIQTALWTCLYSGGSGGTELFGYSYAQMLAYTFIANIVSRLVRTGFEYDLNNDIHSGGLDRFLVKPIDYMGFRMAQFAGSKLAESVFMGAVLALSLVALSAASLFSVAVVQVAAFALSLVLAFLINFLIFWCVGLLGFWLTEIGFLFEALRIVIITLSGGIFPLTVFGALEPALRALPFRFTISFPTEVLAGRVPMADVLPSLGIASLWALGLYALARLVWRVGVRRFVAVGS
jgi:ABC-2 type transport system permease protein